MKKNEALKGLLSHSQQDSEILTKILEEKQGKMPPPQGAGSPKTEVSTSENKENIT